MDMDERHRKAIKLLKQGHQVSTVAREIGIGQASLSDWCCKYPELKKARAECAKLNERHLRNLERTVSETRQLDVKSLQSFILWVKRTRKELASGYDKEDITKWIRAWESANGWTYGRAARWNMNRG